MIACLRGTLLAKLADRLIIDVAGVGYEVFVVQSAFFDLPGEGEELFLQVHMDVRENAITLFGFRYQDEKAIFGLLLTVSGIGPKSALAILSGITPRELAEALASENVVRLVRLPGVGKKTAERLCLELKDKVTTFLAATEPALASRPPDTLSAAEQQVDDVLSVLANLGYTPALAHKAVDGVRKTVPEETFAAMTIEELLRQALRILA